MFVVRSIVSALVTILFPFLGGSILVVAFVLLAIFGGGDDRESFSKYFFFGTQGFCYDLQTFRGRNSGLVLALNWFYFLTFPLWGGSFVTYNIYSSLTDSELEELLGGEVFIWEL